MDDPLFDKVPYLKPYVFFPFPLLEDLLPPIPRREKPARQIHPWENWVYKVVADTDMKGVGTVRVYRFGKRMAQAPVSDWFEARRVFDELIDAAKAVTNEYREVLEKRYRQIQEAEERRRRREV